MKMESKGHSWKTALLSAPALVFAIVCCADENRPASGPVATHPTSLPSTQPADELAPSPYLLDQKDFEQLADSAAKAILGSPVLQQQWEQATKAHGRRPTIAAVQFRNNSTQFLDLDTAIVEPVKEVLTKSGKVGVALLNVQQPREFRIDYVLTGSLNSYRNRSDPLRGRTYVLCVQVLDVREGTIVFGGQTQVIKKKSTRPATSTTQPATRPTDPQTVTIEDYEKLATSAAQALVSSPQFRKQLDDASKPGRRALVRIGPVRNNTIFKVNTQAVLVEPIVAALIESGAARVKADDRALKIALEAGATEDLADFSVQMIFARAGSGAHLTYELDVRVLKSTDGSECFATKVKLGD